jgi:hypothetical protein
MFDKCRSCPKCNRDITYKNKIGYELAIKSNKPCRSCSLRGKKQTEQWKLNISLGRKGKNTGEHNAAKRLEVRKLLSDNNAMKNPIHRAAQLKSVNRKEHKLKLSVGAKKFWENLSTDDRKSFIEKRIHSYSIGLSEGRYEINANRWKVGYYTSSISGISEWYDSSLELSRMKYYDSLGIEWTKKHHIRIPYINSKGLNTFYVPDFLLIKENIIEETKGWLNSSVELKSRAAIEYCRKHNMKYRLLLGKDFIIIKEQSYE